VKHNRDLEGDLSLAMTWNIDLAGMSDDRKTINLVGDMIKWIPWHFENGFLKTQTTTPNQKSPNHKHYYWNKHFRSTRIQVKWWEDSEFRVDEHWKMYIAVHQRVCELQW
jgi:hypothetical protein